LAKAAKDVPLPAALPGQVLFEPKFGGYRIMIFRDRDRASLWSRQGKELTRYSVGVKHHRATLPPHMDMSGRDGQPSHERCLSQGCPFELVDQVHVHLGVYYAGFLERA